MASELRLTRTFVMSQVTENYCGSLVQVVCFVAIADNRYIVYSTVGMTVEKRAFSGRRVWLRGCERARFLSVSGGCCGVLRGAWRSFLRSSRFLASAYK